MPKLVMVYDEVQNKPLVDNLTGVEEPVVLLSGFREETDGITYLKMDEYCLCLAFWLLDQVQNDNHVLSAREAKMIKTTLTLNDKGKGPDELSWKVVS